MKRLFLLVALAAATLSLSAQRKMQVWEGSFYSEFATTVVDSVTFLASPTGTLKPTGIVHDTIIKEVRDTVYIDTCHDDDVPVFSVSATKQVAFSKGNLQYTQSTQKWSFAENQYDMIGEANVSGSALADTIDLFGWSTTASAKWGISTSTEDNDYSGDFVDWGKNIGDGTTYRTLTLDEWTYLFSNRTDATKKKGVARIKLNDDGTQYVNGLILLPDSWTCPTGITFRSSYANEDGEQAYADKNLYTTEQWQQMEAAGAVFLPASGYRSGSDAIGVQYYGVYWSATPVDSDDANSFYFGSDGAYSGYINRYYGHAVRLVQDL